MGGLAALARHAGHRVTGSDAGVYPPMSEQLAALGIDVMQGYDPAHLDPAPDCVLIGNVMSRGNAAVEYVLDKGLTFRSGPQWLAEHLLAGKWVLAVAGTHGKTTTSSMLAWILDYAGLQPGFLIGGVPADFGLSARASASNFFVVEADEYDTAFFDKRSKFVHYLPRTLVLGNLEYDHADIFPNLDAIKHQFHQLLRTVPRQGLVIHNAADSNLDAVLDMGCWTPRESFTVVSDVPGNWRAADVRRSGRSFLVTHETHKPARLDWQLGGLHNVSNALAAIAAARHAGVPVATAIAALQKFSGVRRRMELILEHDGVRIYDDFAHHPTAIASTLRGLADDGGRVLAVLEPRSNTMKMGVHKAALAEALASADRVIVYQGEDLHWDVAEDLAALGDKLLVATDTAGIIDALLAQLQSGDRVVIMSNGGFDGLHRRLVNAVKNTSLAGSD